ncbi:MAG: IMS domain-containing protein [Coleofasciculaceae cyanobacterium]
MRIPLDYYRILGLPIQATVEQRSQAYRDRLLQLPRREYSEAAIKSRKQLLDEAYAVLSDPEQCTAYDASFLANTYEEREQTISLGTAEKSDAPVEPHTPSIEIKNEQFIGALLILQELGEYEIVLKLGKPYLGTRDSISLDKGLLGDPQLVRADIVLTVALACLELGREQWQQGQYENAATSLLSGQDSLLREGLFPAVRGEIQADLYKLRPYRILELLALPAENIDERRNGLRLLQEMLQERMGIDGTGDDQSGLSIDDFLRFIQQLRGYLTAAEQQTLFEAEARRPSAVATYLAVYALLARGFAGRQPALIARAKQMLMRLGKRQDVHLEQAVCALLLGQTEEASSALELSQEYEPLAFIREHSQGAPDLLPGLCLYGERWLQKSVFPHFADLRDQKASLKEYFADEQVQAYLESMPVPSTETPNEWTVVQGQEAPYATATASPGIKEPVTFRREASKNLSGNGQAGDVLYHSAANGSQWTVGREPATTPTNLGATLEKNVSTLPNPQRTASSLGGGNAPGEPSSETLAHLGTTEANGSSDRRSSRRRMSQNGDQVATTQLPEEVSPAAGVGGSHRLGRRSDKTNTTKRRLAFMAIASVAGVAILGFLLITLVSWLQKSLQGTPALEGEQPLVQLAQPPVPTPSAGSQMIAPEGPLTEETAQQAIQTWLSTKALALGSEHQIEQLPKILTDPVLSSWQQRAQTAKQENSYWQYKHSVKVNSVDTKAANPDQARVDAAVNEVADFFQNGQLNQSASYNDNLRVQYDLVRKDGRWLIRDMAVVK